VQSQEADTVGMAQRLRERAASPFARLVRLDRQGDGLIERSRARVTGGLAQREIVSTYALTLGFLAVAVALLVLIPGSGHGGAAAAAALVLCYAAAARVQFEVGFASAVPTQLVFVPMLFLAPLGAVPLLVAAGFALSRLPEHVRGDWHPERIVLHLVSSWYAVGPVLVLWAAGQPDPSPSHLPIVAAALAAQFALDLAGSAVRGCIGLGIPPRDLLRALAPAWLVDLALTPLGVALAFISFAASFAFLLGLPLMLLLAYFARERKERIDHALELSHAYRGTALLLGDMVEADDAYTGLHSQDVVSLVLAVSDHLALDADDRRDAELTALLHDVGKVKIPNSIINKDGPLTPAEREIINTHTIEGEQMLLKVGGLLARVGVLVRSCHERWDGGGYPDGLAGEDIPVVARIVCACDAFSAMTTDRSYRKARSHDDAVAELVRCSGTQFDPRVVDALAAISAPARPLNRAA
jgi:HD-GYP domain-containing protein (c-di-GMP phosphodiesterase class II)